MYRQPGFSATHQQPVCVIVDEWLWVPVLCPELVSCAAAFPPSAPLRPGAVVPASLPVSYNHQRVRWPPPDRHGHGTDASAFCRDSATGRPVPGLDSRYILGGWWPRCERDCFVVQAHGALSLLLAGPLGTYLQAVVVRAVLESIPHDALLSKTPSPLGKNRLVLSQYVAEDDMVRGPCCCMRTALALLRSCYTSRAVPVLNISQPQAHRWCCTGVALDLVSICRILFGYGEAESPRASITLARPRDPCWVMGPNLIEQA